MRLDRKAKLNGKQTNEKMLNCVRNQGLYYNITYILYQPNINLLKFGEGTGLYLLKVKIPYPNLSIPLVLSNNNKVHYERTAVKRCSLNVVISDIVNA